MEIADFLKARLDEDQAWAQMAQSASDDTPWGIGTGPFKADALTAAGLRIAETRSTNISRHVARHDPARVLGQVAAMRRMLDLRYSWALQIEKAPDQVRHVFEAEVSAADAIIRGFAAIWDWHDDYDPAWAVG